MAVRQPHLVSSRSRGVKVCSACNREFPARLEHLSSVFAEHIRLEHRRQDAIEDAGKLIAQSRQLQHDAVVAGLHFVRADLDTALTFARTALDPRSDAAKKKRNRANARKAYNVLLQLMDHLPPDECRASEIREKMTRLRSDLEALGEVFT
jgi:hypothetical protein